MTKTYRKHTERHRCDTKNYQKITKCLHNYLIKELNCKPSWMEDYSDHENCTSAKQWNQFMGLIHGMNSKKIGCSQPNCLQYSWKLKEMFSKDLVQSSMVQYTFNHLVCMVPNCTKRIIANVFLLDSKTYK